MQKWDEEWIKVDQRELFDIILAANYLNIEKLLTLTVETVAQMIKGKTPQVRRLGRGGPSAPPRGKAATLQARAPLATG